MADIYDNLKELTKFELEFDDKNGNPRIFRSYIKCMDEDKILIDPPNYKKHRYNLRVGQEIRIIISSEDGVFLGESKVLYPELSTISGLWISYPFNSQHLQRREYLRVPLNFSCDIRFIEDKQGDSVKTFNIHTRDISGKGFSYLSDELPGRYYDIEAVVHINDNTGKPIITKCEHIYSEAVMVEGKAKFANAMAFVDISENDTERLVKESFKYQLELRRKGLV